MAFQQKSPSSQKSSGVLDWISSGLKKGVRRVAELDIGASSTLLPLTRSEQRALAGGSPSSSRVAVLEGTPSRPAVAGVGLRPKRNVHISPIEMSRGTPKAVALKDGTEDAMDDDALEHNAPVRGTFSPGLSEAVEEGDRALRTVFF